MTHFQQPRLSIDIVMIGERRAPVPDTPPVRGDFLIGPVSGMTAEFRYFVLFDQDPASLEELFRSFTWADPGRSIIAVLGSALHATLQQRAHGLGGVILCSRAEDLFVPLAHLVSVDGLIGLDVADTLSIFRSRVGSVWRGRADTVAKEIDQRGPAASSIAFSAQEGSTIAAIEAAIAPIGRTNPYDLAYHMSAAIADPHEAWASIMHETPAAAGQFDLMPVATYREYRQHARGSSDYCDPFVPFVGDLYGASGVPRLVVCGAAGRWDELERSSESDDIARRVAADWYRDFALSGGNTSPFWKMVHAILATIDPEPGRSRLDRMRGLAWTNLSKLGIPGESAPPSGDLGLRALDVAQMRREIELLRPDLLVCVSGSMVLETGYELFESLAPGPDLFDPKTAGTWVRSMRTGGRLYWTMHPAYKSTEWFERALANIARLAGIKST